MADMKEIAHFRVKVIVEELDANGEVIEVVSGKVVANFENDDDGESIGMQSDNYYNTLLRLSEGI